jgi:hypothetical protein
MVVTGVEGKAEAAVRHRRHRSAADTAASGLDLSGVRLADPGSLAAMPRDLRYLASALDQWAARRAGPDGLPNPNAAVLIGDLPLHAMGEWASRSGGGDGDIVH